MKRRCRVLVFAKAPVAGYAKTRLIPALGAEGAARLAQQLLEHAVQQALAAGLGPVELCAAPDAGHPAMQALRQPGRVELFAQGEGDLGARMARAFARALAAEPGTPTLPVLLIGTDAPGVDAQYLRLAASALRRHDAVFGPALDGGYTLVGLQRPAAQLFEGIPWSTDQVMAETRLRLARSGLRHAELPALPDIDEARDLIHLPAGWPS